MKAQYPMIDWDKPEELEHIPEEEKQEYEGSIIETVHGRECCVCILFGTFL